MLAREPLTNALHCIEGLTNSTGHSMDSLQALRRDHDKLGCISRSRSATLECLGLRACEHLHTPIAERPDEIQSNPLEASWSQLGCCGSLRWFEAPVWLRAKLVNRRQPKAADKSVEPLNPSDQSLGSVGAFDACKQVLSCHTVRIGLVGAKIGPRLYVKPAELEYYIVCTRKTL